LDSFNIVKIDSENIIGKIGKHSDIAQANVFLFLMLSIAFENTVSFAMRLNNPDGEVNLIY
jgi:hypothetical protein